ncbi:MULTISPECIES: MIP/aquaporin family protein [Enterococcaceae]|uniref:MIP/aquaporin family protein n=1 Tax=Enterococcaceae TaxID=81852 RepID=UPI000E4CABEB|nr:MULTISPECIES: aquaporin [Enterococcaceae]MCI0130746.1 aquaporin [Vagococcus sp. CY53-2]RGI30354.1 aquaporin [Melissococcus sp. OM08-11BH]UNM90515.1 aquaporin [Vagococcus sp. CY52-2]
MKKGLAEVIGTFFLVFIGTGTAVLSGNVVGTLGIGLGFGLAIMVAANTIGQISGAHLNPAVTLAFLVNKRLGVQDFIVYVVGQIIGAILGTGLLRLILGMTDLGVDNLAQTTYQGISTTGAFIIEMTLTAILVFVIMSVTSKKGETSYNGLAIGLTLTMLHFIGVPLTGMSVNPVRSLSPAIFVGGDAMSQLWLYILAPLVGGLISAVIAKTLLQTEE